MARKTLLNEHEIRKFLKLANITTVGDKKIHEMGGMPSMGGGAYERDDDEHLEDELGATEDELGAEDELADDEGDELGLADDELADDDLEIDGMETADREELMADVVRAVADALGIADRVDVEAGEGDAMDDMDDLGAEPMDMEPEAALAPEEGGEESLEEPVDLGDEEEEDPMMEDTKKDDELNDDEDDGARGEKKGDKAYVNEDEIVAEVAKRVAARLQNESSKEKMVDALAERILKRLTK
tara:strand:+ start:8249 stop:8977 length:729 start_codon:yes stop_codon:yes gene_type:complete